MEDQDISEIQLLKEIYVNEVDSVETEESAGTTLCLTLRPSTADDKDKQFVYLKLKVKLSAQYPHEVPDLDVTTSRGLAEEHLLQLREELKKLAEQKVGEFMLHDLILLVQESLTSWNVPHVPCPVCWESFRCVDVEPFRKTECFHYLHTVCLLRFIEHSLEEIQRQKQELARHDRHTVQKLDERIRSNYK